MKQRDSATRVGWVSPPRLGPVAAYGAAFAIPALTALVQWGLVPKPTIAPFVLLYLGVTLVSWVAGTGPGLVATAFSAVLGNYFFIAPSDELTLEGAPLVATALFLPTAAAIAVLCGSLRASQLEAREKASRLRRYELLVEHSREMVFFIRPGDGRILDVNRAVVETYGFARDELLHLSIFDLRAPEGRDVARRQMAQADAGELVFETVHQRKDGSRFPVEVSTRGADIDSERAVISLVRDITDRKRAEIAVLESEARFRGVVENMPDGLTLYDENRRVSYVNPALERVAGFTRDEVVGKRADDMWPVPAAPHIGKCLDRAYAGERVRDEYTAVTPTGKTVTRQMVQIPILGSDGRVRQVLAIGHDVTEERQMMEALRVINQRKDEFLAMLSHELRNPLAPIRNSIFVLKRAPNPEQAARAVAVIDRQSAHLVRIVNDLLDLGRISRNAITIDREPVELNGLVRRTAEDYASAFATAGVALEVSTDPQPVVVDGDEQRLVQVLGNLLQNASKFTPSGGRARIEVRRTNGDAEVSVIDTGIGITPEMLGRLFEPFTQGAQTLDRSKGGMGLGLTLSKSIVELHGGELRASSDGVVRGARFTVTLPRVR